MQFKVYLALDIGTGKVEEDQEWSYANEKLEEWLDTASEFGIILEDTEIK